MANLKLCINYHRYADYFLSFFFQNLQTPRYLPISVGMDAEQLKQMIKGGGAADSNWPHRGRQEQTDVKTELAKLNSSKCEIFYLLLQRDEHSIMVSSVCLSKHMAR